MTSQRHITAYGWVLYFVNSWKTPAFLVFKKYQKACVAEQLTPQTPDVEVWGWSLTCRIVSLDKELYYTLCLFTQVYKWRNGDILLGVTFNRLASHPGKHSNTPRHASCWGNRDKLWPFGPLAHVNLYLNWPLWWQQTEQQNTIGLV